MDQSQLRIKIDHDTELRVVSEQDAQALFDLIDQDRAYLREWLPWVDSTISVEDERLFIRGIQAQYAAHTSFACSIWHKGLIVGTIGYHTIDWTHKHVEIGYWLGAAFQGKGLMTKACQAMVTYAFDELKLNQVEIRCATGNTRSCAIPQRLGFTQKRVIEQGEWLYDHFTDMLVYEITASEWQKKPSSN